MVAGEACAAIAISSWQSRDMTDMQVLVHGWGTTCTTAIAPLGYADPDAIGSAITHALTRTTMGPMDIASTMVHGMGAHNSDVPELMAICQVLGTRQNHPLALGNHKANFAHSEYASGLVAVITATCSLRHRSITPHIAISQPIQEISTSECICLPTDHTISVSGDFASISGTSTSGDNIHLIVGLPQSDLDDANEETKPPQPLRSETPKPLQDTRATEFQERGFAVFQGFQTTQF